MIEIRISPVVPMPVHQVVVYQCVGMWQVGMAVAGFGQHLHLFGEVDVLHIRGIAKAVMPPSMVEI
jgi:hypothetical protein